MTKRMSFNSRLADDDKSPVQLFEILIDGEVVSRTMVGREDEISSFPVDFCTLVDVLNAIEGVKSRLDKGYYDKDVSLTYEGWER